MKLTVGPDGVFIDGRWVPATKCAFDIAKVGDLVQANITVEIMPDQLNVVDVEGDVFINLPALGHHKARRLKCVEVLSA